MPDRQTVRPLRSTPRLPALACAVAGHALALAWIVVVAPQRPVAWAGRSVAARLAGETSGASVTLPWARLPALPWL